MNREVQELWIKRDCTDRLLSLHRGTENKVYPVQLRHVFKGLRQFETFLSEGWREFVTSSSLRIRVRVLLVLEDDDGMLYRVRIWRDEKEITVVDPWVLIENDGSISDVDEREYVPNECLWKTPSFECTFTKGYINKPKINITLHFARAHVQGLKDPTDVRLYVSRWWPATMRIQFDINNKILTCTVRKGVSEMIAGEGVELGEKALVELKDMEPPTLGITFT